MNPPKNFYLFSLKFYFSYFDNSFFDGNIFKVLYAGLFSAASSVNNAGIDIFGGATSISMFANDYFIQILTIICFVLGGLGFPVLCDIRNFFVFKKEKKKFKLSYFSKFVLRIYFSIALIAIISVFAIELASGTILYDTSKPLMQRIFYVIFNTFSTRNTGFATIDMNEFATGTKIIFSILMWIGAAPASTGGGVRVTTFFICVLALLSYSKNKKEVYVMYVRILNAATNEFDYLTLKGLDANKIYENTETKEEIPHVNPGKEGQSVILEIPYKAEKGWILRRKK